MVTLEQLKSIARTESASMLVNLLKEFDDLDPKRGRHVCRYIARHLGYSPDDICEFVADDEYGFYVHNGRGVNTETVIVHPTLGIVFNTPSRLVSNDNCDRCGEYTCECSYDDDEDYDPSCDCHECVARRNSNDTEETTTTTQGTE